jgi:hypothetical protein
MGDIGPSKHAFTPGALRRSGPMHKITASFIEFDKQEAILRLEIRGRAVDGQMTVLTHASKCNMNRRGVDFPAHFRRDLMRIPRFIEQVVALDAGSVDNALLDVSRKAGWMIGTHSHIFIQVKELNASPLDGLVCSKPVQKFEL